MRQPKKRQKIRSKSRKRTQPKLLTQSTTQSHESRFFSISVTFGRKTFELGWKFVSALAIILGLVIGIYFFYPEVSVAPNPPLDPSTPFSAPFISSNNSVLRLYQVTFVTFAHRVKCPTNDFRSILMRGFGKLISEFPPHTKSTFFVRFPIKLNQPIIYADITIFFRFEVPLIPFYFKDHYNFVILTDSAGRMQWFPYVASGKKLKKIKMIKRHLPNLPNDIMEQLWQIDELDK